MAAEITPDQLGSAPPSAHPSGVNLTNCDQEPIHVPGSIQPHGVLVVLDDRRRIVMTSASVDALFGVAPAEVLDRPLEAIVEPTDVVELLRRIDVSPLHLQPAYLSTVLARSGGHYDVIAHRNEGVTIVEFEPSRGTGRPDLYRLLDTAIVELRSAPDLQTLFNLMASHVRRMTGFDRVMVYRFDADWNGEVVAEERRAELEPFLGLHYPHSDIPVQARALYTKNRLRFITDRDYVPSPIVPPADPGAGKPLDMSYSVLRSVSPIHLEYLRNMGVGASMSISLLRDGKLWGLIACHHYSRHFVPFELRTACELLGEMMSLQVAAHVVRATNRDLDLKRAMVAELVGDVRVGGDFARSLVDRSATADRLLELVSARGAAVITEEQVFRIGQTPGIAEIKAIAQRLREQSEGPVYSVDRAVDIAGGAHRTVASGMLVAVVASDYRRMIVWFRPEQIRTVNWAGDPEKSITKGDGEVRLSPRGSFALWKATVSGRSEPWSEADLAAAGELRRGILDKLISHVDDVAHRNVLLQQVSDEKEQMLAGERAARVEAMRLNQLKDDFVATLSHELRTPLTAILGWAQLLRIAGNLPEDLSDGPSVIEQNARVQAQMIDDLLDVSRIASGKLNLEFKAVDLPAVIEAAIATVRITAETKNIRIIKFLEPAGGVGVAGDAGRLQQVVWNLLSNAIKFTPKGGHVRVELRRIASQVEIVVSDSGIGISAEFLPHVFDRFRQADGSTNRKHGGLGLGLAIVRHLVELHAGSVFAHSGGIGQGTTFVVTLPIKAVDRPTATDEMNFPLLTDEPGKRLDLTGVRILVIDDEADARNIVARILEEAGAVTSRAGSAAEGLATLHDQTFDLLISDIGMPGEDGYALIARLREWELKRGRTKLPAVALTAYARAEDRRKIILAGFQVHVTKPVEASELLAVVASLAGRL